MDELSGAEIIYRKRDPQALQFVQYIDVALRNHCALRSIRPSVYRRHIPRSEGLRNEFG